MSDAKSDLEHAFFMMLGELTEAMSTIEVGLRTGLCFHAMPNNPYYMLLITRDMYTTRLIDVWRRIIKISDCENNIKEEFDSIVKDIRELDDYRNDVVHSMWFYDEGRKMMRGHKFAKSGNLDVDFYEKYANIGEMNEKLECMKRTFLKLDKFIYHRLFPAIKIELPDFKQ